MKTKKLSLLFVFCLILGLVFAASCKDSSGTTAAPGGDNKASGDAAGKTVSSIEVTKNPAKTEYFVGDTFSAEGGEIKVTYSDNSTEVKSMTDSEVTLSEVNTTISDDTEDSQEKTVTVRYGGKSARFTITVSYEMMTVTFDYKGAADNTVLNVRKGSTVERPEDPAQEGFAFDNWYADEAMTKLFAFDEAIEADTVIYAKWLETSADVVYYDVTFSGNYSGAVDGDPQKVKEGESAVRPSEDPERSGYEFTGWYADAEATAEFDFASAITGDTVIYAGWNSLVSGRNWYVFEAEDTNLNGKSGPGLSGTAGGNGMVQFANYLNASNDRFVGYQYEIGCSLEFQFNSDRAVSDATIVLRLSAELRDFDLDPSTYTVSLNGKDLTYSKISFKNVPKNPDNDVSGVYALPFEDFVIVENATLKEGMNVVSVVTMNDEALTGTTMAAKAPLVDCVKIETEAILEWAHQLGLPKKNY